MAQFHISQTPKTLKEALQELHAQESFDYSLPGDVANDCIIEDEQTFTSLPAALEYMANHCSLHVKQINSTYVFSVLQNNEINFVVFDRGNLEPLPLTNVSLNGRSHYIQPNGRVNVVLNTDDDLLSFSHLGYESRILSAFDIGDTVFMYPKVNHLSDFEFAVQADQKQNTSIGPYSKGVDYTDDHVLHINHRMAKNIPTTSNTLYNLLRLQPGVLAAGEQTQDFIMWGSNKGESAIIFDGITLFRTATFDENISSLSPLVIRDISLYKGGYNVDFTNRIGGVVDIQGIKGQSKQWTTNLNLNNRILSGQTNVPLGKVSNLILAGRTTFFNGLKFEKNIANDSLKYESDHQFRDLNLKWTLLPKKGKEQIEVNLLSSAELQEDRYEDSTSADLSTNRNYNVNQKGGSAFYQHLWNEKHSSKFSVNHTQLQYKELNAVFERGPFANNSDVKKRDVYTSSYMSQSQFALGHKWNTKIAQIDFKSGLLLNASFVNKDTSKFVGKRVGDASVRWESLMKAKFQWGKLSVTPGLINEYDLQRNESFLSPRLGVVYDLTSRISWSVGLGIYRQYATEIATLDELGNAYYTWEVLEKTEDPMMAKHVQTKVSYRNEEWLVIGEVYYKESEHLKRYLLGDNLSTTVHYGDNRSQGFDVMVKRQWGKFDTWGTYTLSKVEERFSYFDAYAYHPAAQNQQHELKMALGVNLKSFYFSTNYVWGSGVSNNYELDKLNLVPYNRWDAALLYQKQVKRFKIETGLSFLNILNSYNVRLNSYTFLPNDRVVYSTATPFTTSLFLNIGF